MFRTLTALLIGPVIAGFLVVPRPAGAQGTNVHVPLRYEELKRWDQYLPRHGKLEERRETYYRPLSRPYRPYYGTGLDYEWEMRSYADRYHHARPGYFNVHVGPDPYPSPMYMYPTTAAGPPVYGTGDWSTPVSPSAPGTWY